MDREKLMLDLFGGAQLAARQREFDRLVAEGRLPAIQLGTTVRQTINPRHTVLTPEQESAFRNWYYRYAQQLGLNQNPDDPRHHYDWRGAFLSGATPDASRHWPSRFKDPDHPNRFVDGVDTITGERVR